MTLNRLGIDAPLPAGLVTVAGHQSPVERWTTLAARPAQLLGFEAWSSALEHESCLSPRERSIARLASTRRSSYEFGLASAAAREVGITDEHILAAGDEDWTADCWTEAERILLRFALLVDAGHGVGDTIVEQLRNHFDDERIIEICQVCAHGGSLSRLSIALRIDGVERRN